MRSRVHLVKKAKTKAAASRQMSSKIDVWAKGRPWKYKHRREFKKHKSGWWCYAETEWETAP